MHGCASIRELFWPLSCRHFATEYFERRHHYVQGSGIVRSFGEAGGSPSVLRSSDLPSMASHWEFKVAVDHSQARVLLPGSFSHDEENYREGSLLDGPAIRLALRRNRTLVFHNVELYWRPIGLLARAAGRAFGGVYSQANVYYSPAGLSSATHAHQDAQSVFIVQCEGRKRWELFAPPQRWRLRNNQRGKAGDVAPAEELSAPLGSFELSPGDVLFVPRGVYHRTSTLVGDAADASLMDASLHITLGVETDTDGWTWMAVLSDAAETLRLPSARPKLDAAMWHDERLREALPLRLCGPNASFGDEPFGGGWTERARALLDEHVIGRSGGGAAPSSAQLRAALDAALRNRSDYVTRKLRQLDEFIEMAPPWPVRRSSVSARAEQSSKFSTRVASPGDMY